MVMKVQTKHLTYAVVLMLLAGLLATLASIGFTVQMQHRADQRWCALLALAATAPDSRPPGIDDVEWARRQQGLRELRKLQVSLGC